MCSLDGLFDSYNYGKIEGLFIVDTLVCTAGKVINSDEGIKMGSTYGEVIVNILRNEYVITIKIYIGTDLEYLDGSFDGYNYGKLEGFFPGDSLRSTYVKVLGSDEVINMGLFYGKVIGNLIVILYEMRLGFDFGNI